MFLSIEQIKAARALLKWTQKDLAQHAGLNDDQVHSFESGRTRSLEVLEAVHDALASSGIDFIAGGVVLRNTKIRQLTGADGFVQFMDDVYNTATLPEPADISVLNVKNEEFLRWIGNKADAHLTRMSKLKLKPARCIISEDYKTDIAKEYSNYRSVDKSLLGDSTLYLYGNKAAIILFSDINVEVTIIENERATKGFRNMFDAIWALSREQAS